LHRRPLSSLSLLRVLDSLLRALDPWLRARPSRLRARPSRIRELPAVLGSWFRGLRSLSLESVLRDAEHLARRPSRLTLGVAAGTVLATGAVLAGVSVGSESPAAAVGDQATARQALPGEGAGNAAPGAAAGDGAPGAATGHAAAAPAASHAAAAPAAGHAAPARAASAAPSVSGRSHASAQHVAKPAAPAPAAASAPASPYLIYDSVIPTAIPASAGMVATYADGARPVPASQVTGRKSVLWIDVTGQDYAASAIDVEPGNASPAVAANWAWHRLSADPHAVARIYTNISAWPTAQAAVAPFPAQMRARIRWWIADPTGTPHMVPGSDATQWFWGPSYDISTAAPRF
jgi:hypothetical protein